jgi:hypothetical protein
MLLSEICGLVSVGRPLWREDGSAICSVITQWSGSRRTRNHTLLSHLRLPQSGLPGSRNYSYIPQEQGGPVILPGTRFVDGLSDPQGLRSEELVLETYVEASFTHQRPCGNWSKHFHTMIATSRYGCVWEQRNTQFRPSWCDLDKYWSIM